MSIIELLCTIGIIGLLAGLLMGPAGRALKKARNADWVDKAELKISRIVDALRAHYRDRDVTERLAPARLRELGVLNEEQLRFLSDRRVLYTPFISADPDDFVVLRVDMPHSFFGGGWLRTVPKVEILPSAQAE